MDNEKIVLTAEELDTIGEVMNISMGAAATAVSSMLEKQVTITTPSLKRIKFQDFDYSALEPAIVVKIKYVEGIDGSNIVILKKHDMKIILDLLMGNEDIGADDDDVEFDEMSMSAACEVMNQMMGASATALSETLIRTINISTPESVVVKKVKELNSLFPDINAEDDVVAISFRMTIKDVLDTTFTCFMSANLTKEIVGFLTGEVENTVVEEIKRQEPQPAPIQQAAPVPPPPPAPQQAAPPPPPAMPPQQEPQMMPQPAVAQPVAEQAPPMPPQAQPAVQWQEVPDSNMEQQMPPQYQQPYANQMPMQQPYAPNGYMQQPMMPPQYQQPYNMMPPQAAPNYYGYPQQQGDAMQPAAVKKPEFPAFNKQSANQGGYPTNMDLLMGVQLQISVVVGRTKKKIKDIMEFGQGTVVELDNQTGAPAEIMVNGKLLAYGDVIVVGDNFGIRVTEIVGTKELLDSLGSDN